MSRFSDLINAIAQNNDELAAIEREIERTAREIERIKKIRDRLKMES